MKASLDTHSTNNTRPLKDLCILYQRFVLSALESVIPLMHKNQFNDKSLARKITMLQN